MATFNVGPLAIDLTLAAPGHINHGYTHAQRAALTDDVLIKVRDLATKSNLVDKMTKGLQVSTYDPTDMKEKSNFFNFVSQWQSILLMMETHYKTYDMESPFHIAVKMTTAPTEDQMMIYQSDLANFFVESKIYGGDVTTYTIPAVAADPAAGVLAAAAQVVNRPVAPEGIIAVADGGFLLHNWHSTSLKRVVESVELQLRYVQDDVHRQNLSWTFQYLMDCLDFDLKQYVLSKVSHLPADVGRSGPVVFQIVAQRILHTTENLAQKVINGFIALRLTHFDAESVIDCIFTLRNVLKFLRYGEPDTFAPRTTIVMLYDVFRGTSVGAFRAYVQQLQDFQLGPGVAPEEIFDRMQLKYEELLLADRWVPQKKKGSAFAMTPGTYADADKKEELGNKDSNKGGGDDKKKKKKTHDKSGKLIDQNA